MPEKKKKGKKKKNPKKGIGDLFGKRFPPTPSPTQKGKDLKAKGKPEPKLMAPKLLPERKVPRGEKPNMLDVAGGAKTVNVKAGGLMKKSRVRGPRDLKKRLTPQQRKEMMDKRLKDKGKLTNPFLKLDKSGKPFMEAKGGGLMEATKRLKAQGLKKGGFPDLSGDGKITMKDVLMGRGVIKKPKKKAMGGSMTLEKGKLKGVKDAPEERRRERAKRVPKGLAMGVAGAMKGTARAMKKAGRLALRGYGKARK
jgi:hypothetical protein